MKWESLDKNTDILTSLPPRGAWIEILSRAYADYLRGRRSPHGERGLKYDLLLVDFSIFPSLPPRGAWIEIPVFVEHTNLYPVAPPTGSVD